ncbi:hypothetical protein GR194_26330, partial [Klebsiella pneumoniae]|nr:hypothetical protein [Klebsiella pneumoniae]
LFGRRRGSGETIWDIKKHIGYVSSSLPWQDTPYEQKRYRYLSPPLVAACITGGTIHVSIFKAAGRRLWCFQDVFRLNSLIRSP